MKRMRDDGKRAKLKRGMLQKRKQKKLSLLFCDYMKKSSTTNCLMNSKSISILWSGVLGFWGCTKGGG